MTRALTRTASKRGLGTFCTKAQGWITCAMEVSRRSTADSVLLLGACLQLKICRRCSHGSLFKKQPPSSEQRYEERFLSSQLDIILNLKTPMTRMTSSLPCIVGLAGSPCSIRSCLPYLLERTGRGPAKIRRLLHPDYAPPRSMQLRGFEMRAVSTVKCFLYQQQSMRASLKPPGGQV